MLIPSDGFKQIAQIYYRVSSRNIHSQIFITKAPQLSWRRGCQHKLLVWIDEDLPPPVESMVWSSNTSASGNDSLFLDTEYWLVCIRDWWWQKARVSQYHDAVIKGVICAHWTFGSSVDDSDDFNHATTMEANKTMRRPLESSGGEHDKCVYNVLLLLAKVPAY